MFNFDNLNDKLQKKMHYSILLIIIIITIIILEIIKTNKSTHLHITIARENKWILFSYIELNISGIYFRYCFIKIYCWSGFTNCQD